jgi:pyruvate/2-oxoglutarate dehydrogenase complex dihydrolipoamide dehydrogenase (E3) component
VYIYPGLGVALASVTRCSPGSRTTTDRQEVGSTVFLTPPFAYVGSPGQEARTQGHRMRVATLPLAITMRAQVLKQPTGLLKAVVEESAGRLIGVVYSAPNQEVIDTARVTMKVRVSYPVLRDNSYIHPSMR